MGGAISGVGGSKMGNSALPLLSRRSFLSASAVSASTLAVYSGFMPLAHADADTDAASLQAKMQGDVLIPSSQDYDSARRTFNFNPKMDRRPAFIARCKTEDDVLHSLEFGRTRGLEIAIRSGGHDVLSDSTIDGGIVIDLAGLDAIEPDPAANTVRVGAGVRSGKLTTALQATNNAVALGCSPQVGVSGLTLGGGIGWLLGTAGAACDNLVSARIITADGRLLTASAEQEPDLFWAIRGGGGNFGIATSLTLRTRTLGNVIGGVIAYPGERLSDFLDFFRDTMSKAPDDLVVEVLASSPSRPVIFVTFCFTGDANRADAVLAPWRQFGPPLADGIGVKAYTEFATPTPEIGKLFQGPPLDPTFRNKRPDIYWMGASLDTLSDGAIRTLVDQTKGAPAGWDFSLGHYMHGAICNVAPDATPFVRAKGAMTYHFDTYWFDEKQATTYMGWVDAGITAMKPRSRSGTYVNYLGADDPAQVQLAYGPNYPRLSRIKRQYDPDNVFHRNRNIKPAP